MKNLIISMHFLFTALTSIYPQNPEWIVYDTSNTVLPSNVVYPISIDQNDAKWIGVFTENFSNVLLVKMDNIDWTIFNFGFQFYAYFNVIAIEGNGVKWMGGGDGLVGGDGLIKFDDTSWTVYNTFNSGLGDNIIFSIAIDSSGNKWIGTYDGGLVKFDDTNWTHYNTSNSDLPSNRVFSIAIDSIGNKWIGTLNGLVKVDGINWTVYNTSNSGLPNNLVYCIAIDEAGNKWIGTWKGGLAKFDDTNWTVYNSINTGQPIDELLSLTADENGKIWIATNYYVGLIEFNGIDWILYNTSNSGLPSNAVYNIAIDNSGNKWIATGGGLAVYNEGGIVSVEGNDLNIPTTFKLEQNYPNPFNPSTNIQYQVTSFSNVSLKVYDVLGKEVATLVNEEKSAGTYEVKFDAEGLSSGIYFYKLQNGDFSDTKKMLLMK